MDIRLRPVLRDEVSLLQAVSLRSFVEAFAAQNSDANMQAYTSYAFTEEKLSEELADPASRFFFAMAGEEVVGYLKINRGTAQTELQDPDSLEIERIYVLPEYYNRGIGQALLDLAIQIGRSEGMHFLWLGVWERNPRAARFYARNGFVAFGSHPFLMGTDLQTDILMRLDLVTA